MKKEKRTRSLLLPVVIVLIFILSLQIWNIVALNSLTKKVDEVDWVIRGTDSILSSSVFDRIDLSIIQLDKVEEQLDTLFIKLDYTQQDVAIIKYLLEH